MPFGVRVSSGEDPAGSTVEEGELEVGPFTEVGADLSPLTSRGSRGGKHDLAVENRGNIALNANVTGVDDSEQVRFDIQPPSVTADPGKSSFAEVEVKPVRRMWRGRPQTRNFAVQVETPGEPPVQMSGTFLQEAIIPGWLIKGLLGLAALLIALLILWFLVLQPTILATAEERAGEVAEEQTRDALEQAGIDPDGPGTETPGPEVSPSPTPDVSPSPTPDVTPEPPPTPEPTPATLLPEGDPVAGRIRADREPVPLTPTPGRTLFVTDLVFSNPNGESGPLQLRRDSEPMISLLLENFRDLDFHFVTPIVVRDGQELDLLCGSCQNASVFYSGYEREE
jgi:hypothetical protein